jgi:hypothetical protein
MGPRDGPSTGTRVSSTGRVAKRTLAALAVGGCALLAAACSSTDPLYPAVHDMPAARSETTLSPDQVKQATDNLVYEREHLNIEAQSGTNPQPVAATNASTTTGSVPQKKSTASGQPAAQSSASAQPAAQQPASGANAYAKQ